MASSRMTSCVLNVLVVLQKVVVAILVVTGDSVQIVPTDDEADRHEVKVETALSDLRSKSKVGHIV